MFSHVLSILHRVSIDVKGDKLVIDNGDLLADLFIENELIGEGVRATKDDAHRVGPRPYATLWDCAMNASEITIKLFIPRSCSVAHISK